MPTLLVIYDPQENTEIIGGGRRMTDGDSWAHHWTRFPNAPFQDVPTLLVNKRVRDEEHAEVFSHLNQVLFRNIDYAFVWLDDADLQVPRKVVHDTSDLDWVWDLEETLRAVTAADVFLAMEVTEHIPFGSNQLRKVGILDMYAQHGIPTIFVGAKVGMRGSGKIRGPGWTRAQTNTPEAVQFCVSSIESGAPMPNAVPVLQGRSQVLVDDFQWMDQVIRILNASKPARVAAHAEFCSYSYLTEGYRWNQADFQPLMEVLAHAIQLERDGADVNVALEPLIQQGWARDNKRGREYNPFMRDFFLHHGGLPSSVGRRHPSNMNKADMSHFHGVRSGQKKMNFKPWSHTNLGSSMVAYVHMIQENHRLALSQGLDESKFPPSWESTEGVVCWSPASDTQGLWAENQYMALLMDLMWCRFDHGGMAVSNRDNRRLLFGLVVNEHTPVRTARDVFFPIVHRTNAHIEELAWYADFWSLRMVFSLVHNGGRTSTALSSAILKL